MLRTWLPDAASIGDMDGLSVQNSNHWQVIIKFAFVADRNAFVDAYLVSGTENVYKAESWKSATICCGFCTNRTTTYGGIFKPWNSVDFEDEEKSRFRGILIVYFVLLGAARQQLVLPSGGIGYMVCSSL